jgi:hypothetical protein
VPRVGVLLVPVAHAHPGVADGLSRVGVHRFTYAGLVKCGTCGGLMSGDLKKGRYVYYRCAGSKGCKRFYPEKVLGTKRCASSRLFRSTRPSLSGSSEKSRSSTTRAWTRPR